MRRSQGLLLPLLCAWCVHASGEQVVLEDSFDNGLAAHWRLVGLQEQDVRTRDGGLEMRVQPGPLSKQAGMLVFDLPAGHVDGLRASIEVTPIDNFTQPGEMAGMCLMRGDAPEFAVKKVLMDRKLLYAPPRYVWVGEGDEQGADPGNFDVRYGQVGDPRTPLVIALNQGYAYFQVGPSGSGRWRNFFHSAIRDDIQQRGFSLFAVGGPAEGEHWVRFDNLRIVVH